MIQRHAILGAILAAIVWALSDPFNVGFHPSYWYIGTVAGTGIGLLVGVGVETIGPRRRPSRIVCWSAIGAAMGLNGGAITALVGLAVGLTGGFWAVGAQAPTVRRVAVTAAAMTLLMTAQISGATHRLRPWLEEQQSSLAAMPAWLTEIAHDTGEAVSATQTASASIVAHALVQVVEFKAASTAYRPDGSAFVTGEVGRGTVGDAATGLKETRLEAHPAFVLYASYRPDGRRLVVCDQKQAPIWDAPVVYQGESFQFY